jgi:hypothetical protein
VEHPCLRCNGSVEEGAPFCPNCGAAQVRFSAREGSASQITVAAATTVHQPQAVFETGHRPLPTFSAADSRLTLRAALYAGLVAAVLSTIPLGPNFILAFPFAGFLSVLFYRRWSAGSEIRPRTGFKLGALAGVFGFVMFLVLMAIATLTFHVQNQLRETMLQAIEQQQARAGDPETRQLLDYFMTAQGMAVMMVAFFLFMGIVLVVLSAAGAALSASLLRPKGPPDG